MVVTEFHALMALASVGWLLVLIFGVLLVRRTHRLASARGEVSNVRERLAEQSGKLDLADRWHADLTEAQYELDALRRNEATLLTRIDERERHVEQTRSQLEDEFRTMAGRLVREAGDALMRDAAQTFEKQHLSARQDAETYSKSVSDLLKPMRDTLNRYEEGLRELRDHQKKAQGELTGQIATLAQSATAVQAEARSLSAALKAGPKTRGRWGETTLRNVVELAGLSAHCDFSEQYSVTDDDRSRKQPDLIVRLPHERMVAVDSKVSLNDWLDAAAAEEETARNDAIDRHGKRVWAHVQALSAKDYAGALKKENAIDFVVMFMPGETFFTAAIDARPTLFQDAYERGVLIATPTTLIAILKSIAHAWRQQRANDSAHAVSQMASDLYESLRKTGTLLFDLGKNLDRTAGSFNGLIANMESRVLPRARRLADYEMPGTEKPIDVVATAEADIRLPSTTKDFVFEPQIAASEDAEPKIAASGR